MTERERERLRGKWSRFEGSLEEGGEHTVAECENEESLLRGLVAQANIYV